MDYDVVVLGAGPAGLAAGLSAHEFGASTLIIERENRPGGILKQCIHDGFGVITFNEKLSGPEYADRYIKMIKENNIPISLNTFVTDIKKQEEDFIITLVNDKKGVFDIKSKAIVLANGCRERTAKQVFIHGTRPAGIYTAGTAQNFVNIQGYLPCAKCVILGSGDIGLIMARRLTLEGAKVIGVYEAKSTPSGLTRNIVQCLEDYNIPLHLSHTIINIFGDERVEAVEIAKVDEKMNPIEGTEEKIQCDGVILSVGLIPENEVAEKLGVKIDFNTKGPSVDQNFMTNIKGAFSCGNALHVNDLVDYVSESGKLAGQNAASYANTLSIYNGGSSLLNSIKSSSSMLHLTTLEGDLTPTKVTSKAGLLPPIEDGRFEAFQNVVKKVNVEKEFLYVVPQSIETKSNNKKVILYFRTKDVEHNAKVVVKYGERVHFMKKYSHLKPPEMERIELDLSNITFSDSEEFSVELIRGQLMENRG